MSFAKTNYGDKKEFKKKKHFGTSKGDVVARIFPALGSAEETKDYFSYHSVHFGYKNSKGEFRPFESPLEDSYDRDTKIRTVLVADAALDRLNDLKAKMAKAKTEGNVALEAKLHALVGFQGVYNIDNNVHMNVMLLDGSLGELKIRYKHFTVLKAEIDKLRAQGVDPLSLTEGRFFVFSKSGRGNETNFKVDVYKEKVEAIVNGKTKMVDEDLVSFVPQEVLSRVDSELHDLDNLFVKPTAEEVAQIVAQSDLLTGKSPACDEIFDARWKAKRDASKSAPSQALAGERMILHPDAILATAPATHTPSDSKELLDQLSTLPGNATLGNPVYRAAVMGPGAAPPVNTVSPVAAAKPTQSIDEMSDADFFAAMGVDT